MLDHPGREGLLDQLCINRRQAVLGLQDDYCSGLEILILRERFYISDELNPDRGRIVGTKLFPERCGGWIPSSELARADRRRLKAGFGRKTSLCGLVVL